MADQPSVPAETRGEPESAVPPPSPTPSSKRKVLVLLVALVVVVLLLGGLGAYLMLYGKGAEEEVAAPRVVPEAIGPRSVLEGIDKLQQAHAQAQKSFSADLGKLVDEYAKDPKVYSAAWRSAVSNELANSNLFVRVLPDGFELALRQGEKRWLVYSRLGSAAPRISTQETDGAPPFGGGGAAEAQAGRVAPQVNLQEYKEPQDYFSLMLPEGFSVSHGGPGTSIRVTFTYTNGVRMTVKAMESNRGWEPITELTAKAEQIRGGSVPAFADFQLAVTNLLDVEGGTGYEMGLVGTGAKAGVYTHTFALGGERTLLSVAVLCPSAGARDLYESLLASVRDTMRIGLGPARKVVATVPSKTVSTNAAISATPREAEPPPLTEEEQKQWTEARTLLKTTGIMRSGDAYVALVNDQLVRVDDVVTVSIKNKPFKFRVSQITVDEVKFEPVLRSGSKSPETKSM